MRWQWWIVRIAGVALIILGAALWAKAQDPAAAPPPAEEAPLPPIIPAPRPRTSTAGFRFGPPAPADAMPLDLSVLAAQSAAPAPVVPTTALPTSSTAPAAATALTPAISVQVPHANDGRIHLSHVHVRHWEFPTLPARPAKSTPPPAVVKDAEPIRPSPQAPSKWFHPFGR